MPHLFRNHDKQSNAYIRQNYEKSPEDIKAFLHTCGNHEVKDMMEYIQDTLRPPTQKTMNESVYYLMDLIPSIQHAAAGNTLLLIADKKFDFTPYKLSKKTETDLTIQAEKYQGASKEFYLLNRFLSDVRTQYKDRLERESGCSVARCSNNIAMQC